jgi:hypothetical protein
MLDGLGTVWLTDTLAYKEYPGCAYLQPAVEAVLRLREENGIEPADVARIDVRAGWLTTSMEKLAAGEPLTGVRVNFSVALSAAVALVAGRLSQDELDDAWLGDHEDELRDLATRVFLTHDWDLTMQTIRGAWYPEALQDIPLRRLTGLRRRMQETGMDEIGIGLGDLREFVRRVDGGTLRGLIRRGGANGGAGGSGPAGIDTSQMRLTFPCHVAIQLRSGGTLETDGREHGACGTPLDEQESVVSTKFDAVRQAADMPRAWRRRPVAAQAEPA